jgi:hypothetical protein
MKLFYSLKRHLRVLIRSIFNQKVPEWLIDLYNALDYVNIINLIPTLWAIQFAPDHFFRRVYLLIERRTAGVKESLFKSPIQLITTTVTLIATTKWIGAYLPQGRQKLLLGLLLVAMPVLIPAVCSILYIFGQVSYFFVTHGLPSLLFLGWLPKSAKLSLFLSCRQGIRYLRVPISPEIYRNIDFQKMRWNGLYFYGYLISFPLLISVVLGTWVMVLTKGTRMELPDHYSAGENWVVAVLLGALTAAYGRIVAYPYSVALLQALKKPTKLSRQIEMHRWLVASELLLIRSKNHLAPMDKKLDESKRIEQWNIVLPKLISEISAFRSKWYPIHPQLLRWHRRFRVAENARVDENILLLSAHEGLYEIYTHFVAADPSAEQIEMLAKIIRVK